MRVALDSTPPVRRRASMSTCASRFRVQAAAPRCPNGRRTEVGNKLGLPTTTARRNLEDLASYGLVKEQAQGPGRPSLWQAIILP